MNLDKSLTFLALTAVAVAVGMGIHLTRESKALSYLSSEPAECINCHVMDAYYASWQNSSHARVTTCVDCHLPTTNIVDKYLSKARDGWNHSVAFTTNSYGKRLLISEDGARRVQENCVRCHAARTQTLVAGSDGHYAAAGGSLGERQCWDCHRLVPHGEVRSINSSPHNLNVRKTR